MKDWNIYILDILDDTDDDDEDESRAHQDDSDSDEDRPAAKRMNKTGLWGRRLELLNLTRNAFKIYVGLLRIRIL